MGCAVLSVFLIVGLVFLGTKARSLVDWAMGLIENQVLLACVPEVTAGEKTQFKEAYRSFTGKARDGKLPSSRLTAFRSQATAALADGRVTPEELKELTRAASGGGP